MPHPQDASILSECKSTTLQEEIHKGMLVAAGSSINAVYYCQGCKVCLVKPPNLLTVMMEGAGCRFPPHSHVTSMRDLWEST